MSPRNDLVPTLVLIISMNRDSFSFHLPDFENERFLSVPSI